MCKFKSGVILKNRVVLAPMYNDSHSRLLESLKIEDNDINAMKMFVRAELIPANNDKTTDVGSWRFVVDQDVVPEWFKEEPERYEADFRNAVKEWMSANFVKMAGKMWTPIKKDEKGTYYLLADKLFDSEFGENNNYEKSVIRKKLNDCDLVNDLKAEFGDRLVPITTDLTSLDGFKDYGVIDGDILAIPTLDLYRECRENILNLDSWWWLATPNSTPSGCGSDRVQCVLSYGGVDYFWYNRCNGVRPFCLLKS